MIAIHFSSRTKTLLIWGGILLTLGFLFLLGSIVTPFLWALVTAFILNAIVTWAGRRLGGPRWLWVVVLYFGLVAALVWGLIAVVPVLGFQIRQLVNEVPAYLSQIEDWLRTVQLGDIRMPTTQIGDTIRRAVNDYLGGLGSRAPELALLIGERLLKILLYLVATFYFLLQTPRIVSNVRGLFPSDVLEELDPWIRRINHTLAAYLRGQALLVGIISVATFIGLSVLGVRFALALAIMSGLVETVPYLGPYAAGGVAVLVAMTQTEPNTFGWPPLALGVAVAILYTIIRQVEDNLVMPFVIGHTVRLHPLTVIFVVLAGASLGGILGLLLAVPVAATLKIIIEFLWTKIKEPDPRESQVVGSHTTWDTLARRIRGGRGGRLILIMPAGMSHPALSEASDYRRLVLLAAEHQVDLKIITDDVQVAGSAQAMGIPVEEQAGQQFAHTAASALTTGRLDGADVDQGAPSTGGDASGEPPARAPGLLDLGARPALIGEPPIRRPPVSSGPQERA